MGYVMTRLSMLVGIGLMLVGAAAYALPEVQNFIALFPAFAGIIIATAGFAARSHERFRRPLLVIAALTALVVLVYTTIRMGPDSSLTPGNRSQFISDIDALGLSILYLAVAAKNLWFNKKSSNVA